MLRCFLLFLLFTVTARSASAQDSTYMGIEFWAGYGHHQYMESGTNTQELVFYLSTQQDPATVTITIDSCATPWYRTYNIPANSVITSDPIPKAGGSDARLHSPPVAFGGTGSVGAFTKKGIHIVSTAPIAVYSHIYGALSSGASLLLPVQTWGYSYQSLNSKQQYANNCYSWLYIIAKEDNTSIEIKPSVLTSNQAFTGLQPGIPSIITLQKGHIYQVLGEFTQPGSNNGYELTGTSIRSMTMGKPIAVFSGSSRTSNPATCGSGGGDNDMVQLFPLHTWGKEYLTAALSASNLASSLSKAIYKIMVYDPSTVVTKNGVALPNPNLYNNSYYIYESNTADHIVADKPVMVAQFMTGGSVCTTGLGDPDMYYLSPIDAGVKKVNCVRTSYESISINYVTLIIPTNGMSSLQIDGSSAFTHSYAHPSMAGYSVVIKSWPASISQLTIQSDSSFTGVAYGMGNVESYGYNLGANFRHNNGLDPLVPMYWAGTISTDWFNSGNWSTGKVPTNVDYIVIPAGTPFSPMIASGLTANCKSISAESGASVNVGTNANLNVAGK